MEILIVGAGPSGLMCAYELARNFCKVTVIEKNDQVGKKILITGKGRCNVTNNCTKEEFFSNIATNSKFLYSAYNSFSSQDTMNFFENHGVSLITERGNRVFPKSYQASDISKSLFKACLEQGVKFQLNECVKSIGKQENKFKIVTNKSKYFSDKVVIATGGKSYRYTGSTGDGYKFATDFGHTIVEPVPALIGFKIKETIPDELVKFTLKNVKLNVTTSTKKYSEFGELTFYKDQLAGPIALTISSKINRICKEDVHISIDLKPALSPKTLDERILREIGDKKNKNINDILSKLLPKEMIEWFENIAGIDKYLQLSIFSKEMRKNIVEKLKSFPLNFDGLDDIDRAVVTSGGINVKELNPSTVESKKACGLYFAGEVIDVDAYTGGFNLQIAFSTGVLAAKSILKTN